MASTDNVGVTGYRIYQNGTLHSTVTATNATVTGLSPNTSYTFYVVAIDAAGNVSAASNTVMVTTLPVTLSYCTSKGNSTTYEYINRVVLGSINNTSGNNGGYGEGRGGCDRRRDQSRR